MAVFVLVWQQIILQVWQRFQAVIIFLLFPLSRVNIWKVKFDIQSPSHEYADIPTFTAFTLSSTFENNHNQQKFPSQVIVILTNAPFKGRYAHPPRDGGRVRCRKSSWWWNPFMRPIVFLYAICLFMAAVGNAANLPGKCIPHPHHNVIKSFHWYRVRMELSFTQIGFPASPSSTNIYMH